MIRTFLRLHRAGRLTRQDYAFLAVTAAIFLICLWMAAVIGWAILGPVCDCWRSPDCWGGM